MALIKCPDCGKEYSSFAGVCPVCGCPNDGNTQQSDPTGKFCPDCGKSIDPSAKTCPYCGCPMEEEPPKNNISNGEKDGGIRDSWKDIKSEFTSPHTNHSYGQEESNTKFVKDSLLHDEKILCAAKWHWINYILPVLFIVAGIFFIIGSFADIDDLWYLIILGILSGIIGYVGILEMKKYEFVLTNKRIFIKQGIILRWSYELRLEKLESIQVYQGIIGRLLNFGIVLVHGVGASRGIAGMLVAPLEFRQHIFAEISKQNENNKEK